MSSLERFNLVYFVPDPAAGGDGSGASGAAAGQRIALTLDHPWAYAAGLKPNVNTATVPWTEFDKLGSIIDRTGAIEFWYSLGTDQGGGRADGALADVVLRNWRLVEVQPTRTGVPAGKQFPRIVEYRLSFADFREQYVEPRGGRLRAGLLNGNPKSKTQSQQAQDLLGSLNSALDEIAGGDVGGGVSDALQAGLQAATPPQIPEKTLAELIEMCLDVMFGARPGVPDLGDVEAPRELKWFGNHAPTELAKLLEVAGCIFCPHNDGTGSVEKIRTAGNVQTTAADADYMPEMPLPQIDRRGKTVVYSSFPAQTAETIVLEGPRLDQWSFVLQDSNDVWQWIDACDLVNTDGGLLSHWKDKFKRIPEKFRQRVALQAYRCLQLGDGSKPPAGTKPNEVLKLPPARLCPVWNRRIEKDGSLQDVEVRAKIALHDDNFLWTNTKDLVRIGAQFRTDANVLFLDSPLVQVKQPTMDRFNDAQELKKGEIQVRFTIPKYAQASDGSWKPAFFNVGFQRSGGDLRQLADDEVENALNGQGGASKDVIVIPKGEMLRLRIITDNPANKQQLIDMAKGWADRDLADSGNPTRVVQFRGFAWVLIDGLVSEVQYDQHELKTTVTLNNWYRPGGALDASRLTKAEADAGKGAEAYPLQQQSQEKRVALFEPGATQPITPLLPLGAPDVTGPGAAWALITNFLPQTGLYDGTVYTGSPSLDGQSDLTMPAGMTAGPSVLIANLDEASPQSDMFGNAMAGGTSRLQTGTPVKGSIFGMSDENPPRPIFWTGGGVGDMVSNLVTFDLLSPLTVDARKWARLIDGVGINVFLQTRFVWDDTNDQFIGFQRQLSFDANGRLFRVGPEEQFVPTTFIKCNTSS